MVKMENGEWKNGSKSPLIPDPILDPIPDPDCQKSKSLKSVFKKKRKKYIIRSTGGIKNIFYYSHRREVGTPDY